ncbi:hypothetical protein L1987_18535 [Smallanthus sonchifolius]|uniref:Uncharacterized protein n=1 Tax=Smallanthus sonchifolius TaxID=185202 RepID=A0ACB9J2K8_9ASTR|nr:hypothetical protein L1987_18535 [Smallanthus sonchifolius]
MFESFALAEQQQPRSVRTSIPTARTSTSSTRGVHQLTPDASVAAALAAMSKEIKELKLSAQKCEVYKGGHDTCDCPVNQQEQVEYVSNQNRCFNNAFGNTFNLGWRSGGNPPGFQQRPNRMMEAIQGGPSSGPNASVMAVTTRSQRVEEREEPPVDEELEMEKPPEKAEKKKGGR